MKLDGKLLTDAGFKRKSKNFHRTINDVVQLINFQTSDYSTDVYINIAIWPLALGEPTSLLEYKFPIRGRIEDFVFSEEKPEDDAAVKLLIELNSSLSSLSDLKEKRRNGQLSSIYLSFAARELLDS